MIDSEGQLPAAMAAISDGSREFSGRIPRSSASKRSNWVRGRAGAAANGQRRRRQQELRSVPGCCRIPERLEIAVIEKVHAQVHEREIMNGAAQLRWGNVLRMIAAEDGDVALFEPGNNRRIKSRRLAAFSAAAQPGPDCLPASPHAGAHEQRIAG